MGLPPHPCCLDTCYAGDVSFLARRVRRAGYSPKSHLTKAAFPTPGMDPGPPLRRGGAPGPSCGKPRVPVSVRPSLLLPTHAQSSHVPSLGGMTGSHRHSHPLYLCFCGTSSGINAVAAVTTRPAARPQPAPFTTPLGLQTVTLATNLTAASRAHAGSGRGARSLALQPLGPAPRTQPRPRRSGARSHWATSYVRPFSVSACYFSTNVSAAAKGQIY